MEYIRVRVTASAKNTTVVETEKGVLKISVREPAEDNRANIAVLSIVAGFYNIPKNKLRIVSGHQKPSKRIEVLS